MNPCVILGKHCHRGTMLRQTLVQQAPLRSGRQSTGTSSHVKRIGCRVRNNVPNLSSLSSVDLDAQSTLQMQMHITNQTKGSQEGDDKQKSVEVPRSVQARSATVDSTSETSSNEFNRTARAAYQGVPGAYSEQAALKACPGLELLPCPQFEIAFQALTQWSAERAVLPIENSLGGSIHANYDLLLRYNLHIVGETSVEVSHCLMALPGVELKDIKRVTSHPQALAQCDGYIRRLPGVVREEADDTAGAAQHIAKNGLRDVAAIASSRAAELYGMNILDKGIQDMADNVTRFIVLSRDPMVVTDPDSTKYKTSIVFSLRQGPGQLFKALSVFALRDIDLTKIESRPMRSNPMVPASKSTTSNKNDTERRFNFLFYIDFIGNLANKDCQNALRHLQEIAPFLRVLGSYPRGNI